MPSNNSKERRALRRRHAAARLRLHAGNRLGCDRKVSKHSDAEHAAMLAEAVRIEAKGI